MSLVIKFCLLFLVLHEINCSNCSSDILQWNKSDNYNKNVTLNYLEESLKDSEFEDLPHYIVPNISNYEKGFIEVLSKQYMKLERPFDLSHISNITSECRADSHKFIEALKKFELWALKMHDATAKISSGLLNGNVNQFGDFDQCLNVIASDNDFQGKYCLAYLQPSASKSLKFTNYLRKLLQSHEAFKSNFDDPGHRVPRYSTINWGICVPSSCTHQDVEVALTYYIKRFTSGTGINVDIRVEKTMCQVKDRKWFMNLTQSTIIAISSMIILLLIILGSTFYDYNSPIESKSQLLTSFSFIRNMRSLTTIRHESGEIKVAHAIRFFNAIMLVVAHKCMALFFNPYSNRTDMTEMLGKPWTVLARAASLYTDPFLMLSGMLTAHSLIGKLQRGHRINILKEYLGRYLRIMPSLAFLIAFCTFILPLLGDGPQWNLVVTHHSDICKNYWWRNLLFIHNWFGFSNLCLTHTHHLGIDTELFWISPFLILTLWKWPKKGMKMLFGLAALSTIARYYVTFKYDLSNYVFYGTSIKQMFETADIMYINPLHRFTVYAMGISLGYILQMFKDYKLSEQQLKIGWYVSIASILLAFFGPAPMGDIDYKFNATHAAHYAALAPIAWCMFFGWVILVSQLGHKNKFISVLEWKGFSFCTKLSYGLYLTQFPVFFYNVGKVRSPIQYNFFNIILSTNEFICIIAVTIALTLFVEMPCNNLKTLLFDKKRVPRSEKKQLDLNSNIKVKHL